MKGSGGTEGGVFEYLVGLCLAGLAIYLFFDSVHMASGQYGVFSGMLGGGRQGGHWDTTSMGIIFVPFGIGVFSLFVNAEQKWAWWIAWIGLAVIAIEMLSRIRFLMEIKTSHFILMLVLFLFGCALMFRSYRATRLLPPHDAGSAS